MNPLHMMKRKRKRTPQSVYITIWKFLFSFVVFGGLCYALYVVLLLDPLVNSEDIYTLGIGGDDCSEIPFLDFNIRGNVNSTNANNIRIQVIKQESRCPQSQYIDLNVDVQDDGTFSVTSSYFADNTIFIQVSGEGYVTCEIEVGVASYHEVEIDLNIIADDTLLVSGTEILRPLLGQPPQPQREINYCS